MTRSGPRRSSVPETRSDINTRCLTAAPVLSPPDITGLIDRLRPFFGDAIGRRHYRLGYGTGTGQSLGPTESVQVIRPWISGEMGVLAAM